MNSRALHDLIQFRIAGNASRALQFTTLRVDVVRKETGGARGDVIHTLFHQDWCLRQETKGEGTEAEGGGYGGR